MRQLTTVELNRIQALTERSIELTLIEPTATGLAKSILDATGPVRTYLREKRLHDYNLQKQGLENRIRIDSTLIKENTLVRSIASLYRPNTKSGDPRIWFKELADYANPNDILGLFEYERKIFVLNLSLIDVEKLLQSKTSNPLAELINLIQGKSNLVADELLLLLKKISKQPVPALLAADTAIGRTLETLLGIDINCSKKPDFKGIELKSFRDNRGNRKNLFAQVPDWSRSKFKSSEEILNNFGYFRGEEFKLYCTVSALSRNSQGLQLRVDNKTNQLLESCYNPHIADFVSWPLVTLHSRLLEKHNETFWIAAEAITFDQKEYFQFKKVEHTKKPIVSQFDILLAQGMITVDHLIKRCGNGKVAEKGPLFKIQPNSLNLLFPPSKLYYLI